MSTIYKCDNCQAVSGTRTAHWVHQNFKRLFESHLEPSGIKVVLNTDHGIYRDTGREHHIDLCIKCWYEAARKALNESEARYAE